MTDTVEIIRVEPILNEWRVRLNGDGNTFDAVCSVRAISETELFVEAGMSKVRGGIERMHRLAKPEFKAKGYKTFSYIHNGSKFVENV